MTLNQSNRSTHCFVNWTPSETNWEIWKSKWNACYFQQLKEFKQCSRSTKFKEKVNKSRNCSNLNTKWPRTTSSCSVFRLYNSAVCIWIGNPLFLFWLVWGWRQSRTVSTREESAPFCPKIENQKLGVSYTWVGDYYNFTVTWYQKIKAKVWVHLVLGCDLYTGEYGKSCDAKGSCILDSLFPSKSYLTTGPDPRCKQMKK